MKDKVYLVFNKHGVGKMTKNPPPLRAGEYAVRIDVTVDDKYFRRIIPIAKMELDEEFLIEPKIQLEPVVVEEDTPEGEEINAST